MATVAAGLGLALLYLISWPRLPSRVAVHASATGLVNGYLPKPLALLLGEGLLGLVGLVFWLVGRDRRLTGKAALSLQAGWIAVLGFLFALQASLLLVGRGHRLNTTLVVAAGGVLLLIVGNFLPVLPRNRLAGIRTPWTERSDRVWQRTHRIGGPLFMVAGLATLLGLASPDPSTQIGVLVGSILVVGCVTVALSWWISRGEAADG